jgi:hypothetical protein
VQRDIGLSLLNLQQAERPALAAQPMQCIGQGVFEPKSEDDATWCRVVTLLESKTQSLCSIPSRRKAGRLRKTTSIERGRG